MTTYDISIISQPKTVEELANLLRLIAKELEKGNSSGPNPAWYLKEIHSLD